MAAAVAEAAPFRPQAAAPRLEFSAQDLMSTKAWTLEFALPLPVLEGV